GSLIETPGQRAELQLGEVLAVGPGAWDAQRSRRRPCRVTVGQTVAFHRRVGSDWSLEGQAYRIVRDSEILGVLADAAEARQTA
ncbi:MAG: hypothetical protein WC485_12165, partial [Opitutaceae bacterium]